MPRKPTPPSAKSTSKARPSAKAASLKRAYLARDDRRVALLDVAATVVETQGWPALSMMAVAEAAQVSRQLVYQHFASVDELMADTMSHLFRSRYENIRRSIGAAGNDLVGLVRIVEHETFAENPARVRALWQMITATYSDNAETSRMGRRLRHLLTNLWTPLLMRQLDLKEPQARALTWMLHMAFWGAHQLEHDGELSRKSANELFTWMLVKLMSGEEPAQSPPPTSAASKKPAPRRKGSN